MPLDTPHLPKQRCRHSTLPHGNGTPRLQWCQHQDSAPHCKTCSGWPKGGSKELMVSTWSPKSSLPNLIDYSIFGMWHHSNQWRSHLTTGHKGPATNALVPDTSVQALIGADLLRMHAPAWKRCLIGLGSWECRCQLDFLSSLWPSLGHSWAVWDVSVHIDLVEVAPPLRSTIAI